MFYGFRYIIQEPKELKMTPKCVHSRAYKDAVKQALLVGFTKEEAAIAGQEAGRKAVEEPELGETVAYM